MTCPVPQSPWWRPLSVVQCLSLCLVGRSSECAVLRVHSHWSSAALWTGGTEGAGEDIYHNSVNSLLTSVVPAPPPVSVFH